MTRLIAGGFAVVILALSPQPRLAQQPPARADSVPLRADYRDLAELLQKLPAVAAPTFDESRALWLGALPLACLDRLHARPGGRGGAAARAVTPGDTGVARLAPAPAGNTGAGYFWVPTYSLVADHDRLRAFWGCNDWHSAVGSTWVTVRLLRHYPNSALHELAREKLNAHLGKANLDGELKFFRDAAAAINPIPSAATQAGLFERPYGFAWLLKLHSELRTWTDTQAVRWTANVGALAVWMADSLGAYLAKLVEPVRTGAQGNTALAMTLALDYADVALDTKLRGVVVAQARKFYLADSTCATQNERVVPAAGGRGGRGGGDRGGRGAGAAAGAAGAIADSASREPNDLTKTGRGAVPPVPFGGAGPEIVSPCLTEAALMARVLEQRAFVSWLDRFLPPLQSGRFSPLTEAIAIPVTAPAPAGGAGGAGGAAGRGGAAPDTSAAGIAAAAAAAATALAVERARVGGLSFARAQAMERIARGLPARDARVAAWRRLSAIQAERGFELMRDDAAGLSWLPAQALLYVSVRN